MQDSPESGESAKSADAAGMLCQIQQQKAEWTQPLRITRFMNHRYGVGRSFPSTSIIIWVAGKFGSRPVAVSFLGVELFATASANPIELPDPPGSSFVLDLDQRCLNGSRHSR
jgi:hypothetical protein